MGVAPDVIGQFSNEFISGMAGEDSRSRRLGDVGDSAPEQWLWGGRAERPELAETPHVLVMLYAREGQLDALKQAICGEYWDKAFATVQTLESFGLTRFEPFGFSDGISQPEIDWEQTKKLPAEQSEYSNNVALGEFLLGYTNEYGKYTERPLLPRGEDSSAGLLPAEEDASHRDLGRNGSYVVVRQLEQDVAGFRDFVNAQSQNSSEASSLAAAMVGRRKDGEPLIGSESANSGDLNAFTYESDPDGTRCPFGAHIRRTNPRNGDYPYGTRGLWRRLLRIAGFHRTSFRDDLVSSTRFHRLLRRGRGYRTVVSGGAEKQGIHFIAINANISRQFEFVQNAWLMTGKFNGVGDESDPLVGNREALGACPATDAFSLPRENGIARRVPALPQFVTVRGGAYFFLPSIRALWYIATVG
jgi:Dyp-type peroxidase family